MDRKEAIARIKNALQKRSGKAWSVTGGKGTAYGWLKIEAPPARRTEHAVHRPDTFTDRSEDYEMRDTGEPGGDTTHAERLELAQLLGWPEGEGKPVHMQGASIPASGDYWQEYIDRAEGRTPAKLGVMYWD